MLNEGQYLNLWIRNQDGWHVVCTESDNPIDMMYLVQIIFDKNFYFCKSWDDYSNLGGTTWYINNSDKNGSIMIEHFWQLFRSLSKTELTS